MRFGICPEWWTSERFKVDPARYSLSAQPAGMSLMSSISRCRHNTPTSCLMFDIFAVSTRGQELCRHPGRLSASRADQELCMNVDILAVGTTAANGALEKDLKLTVCMEADMSFKSDVSVTSRDRIQTMFTSLSNTNAWFCPKSSIIQAWK